VTVYDEPVLAGFGIAGLRGTASERARLSGLTLHHAAPEVLLGSEATPASDVYGLASVLHELLTGHAPFFVTDEEDAAALQRRIIVDAPPRLAAPGATAPLRDLLRRAMHKDPARRTGSALELAQQLRALEQQAGWPITTCRVDGLDHLPPPQQFGERAVTGSGVTGVPALGLPARPLREVAADRRELPRPDPRDRGYLPGRDAPLLPSAPSRVVRHSRRPEDAPAPTGPPVELPTPEEDGPRRWAYAPAGRTGEGGRWHTTHVTDRLASPTPR
jgi:serine/threonine protein kinase